MLEWSRPRNACLLSEGRDSVIFHRLHEIFSEIWPHPADQKWSARLPLVIHQSENCGRNLNTPANQSYAHIVHIPIYPLGLNTWATNNTVAYQATWLDIYICIYKYIYIYFLICYIMLLLKRLIKNKSFRTSVSGGQKIGLVYPLVVLQISPPFHS
jgi:hypothetical protein